jgi:hypothetical protein
METAIVGACGRSGGVFVWQESALLSLKSGGRFVLVRLIRMFSFAVKMFSRLISFKKCSTLCTFSAVCKDDAVTLCLPAHHNFGVCYYASVYTIVIVANVRHS